MVAMVMSPCKYPLTPPLGIFFIAIFPRVAAIGMDALMDMTRVAATMIKLVEIRCMVHNQLIRYICTNIS
jgi:hypothetical protein